MNASALGGVALLLFGVTAVTANALTAATETGDTWTPAGTKRGVTLEFRDDSELDAREVRATAELPFPVPVILPVVCDFTSYGTLVPGVTEARRLAPPSDAPRAGAPVDHVYLRYAPRFLVVAARDVVVRVERRPPTDASEGCRWSEVDGRVPPHDGTVRIPLLRGEWTATAVDASRSTVMYRFAVRPGGRLPGWLVRRGATGALVDVIDNLRARLRERTAELPSPRR